MAETGAGHALFLFLLSITLFLVLLNSVIAGPNGLTMKLIHRDSIESPLYPGNLTREERIQRLVEQSKARIQYLTSAKWHPLCEPNKCWGDACSYDTLYGTGSTTRGILASERLTVISDTGAPETIENVVIGCGKEQRNFKPFQRSHVVNEIAGILGIGRGPKSFLAQLGQRGDGRFAYCLQPWDGGIAPHTYLRFGEDAKIGGRAQVVQTIRMFSSNRFPLLYYLELEDLSIGDPRLYLPVGTFGFKRDWQGRVKGGCIIDSGSPWTTFGRNIYNIFRAYVTHHFANFTQLIEHDTRFELCYQRPVEFDDFPTITFHFRGANFVVEPHAAFYVTDNSFCLAFSPLNTDIDIVDAIIGARQMTNHRILYDVKNSALSFSKEDCTIGS
ncbi:Peptidase A1 [Macleaya cordata]|uniref:Peptidase A1 n=1 Tax=Macleaya cordata TaxID=56857 RepID=A0A200QX99_MACCD|nr:Peptidase A1 [Macleaya cordata]